MNIKIKSDCFIPPSASPDKYLIPVHYINYCINKPKPYNHFIGNLGALTPHLMSKSKLWEYEQEVRLLLTNNMILKNPVRLETNEIGEIIFGLRTPFELIDKVRQIVKKYPNNGSHVKLYKCVEEKGQYTINKKRI